MPTFWKKKTLSLLYWQTDYAIGVDTAPEGAEIWVAVSIYTGTHNRNGLVQMVNISQPLTIRGGVYAAI